MSQTAPIIGKRRAAPKEIQKLVQIIVRRFKPEKIILFGSYAKGKSKKESDIDLFIIVDSNRPIWQISTEISLALDHTFPLDIIIKTKDEVNKRLSLGDFFIEDVVKNGKVLYERTG